MRIVWIVLALGVSIGSADCSGDAVSTPKQRINRCMHNAQNLAPGTNTFFTQTSAGMCKAAESDGYLNDYGTMSKEHAAYEVRANFKLATTACTKFYDEIGQTWSFNEGYLPTGGLWEMATNLCSHLKMFTHAQRFGVRLDPPESLRSFMVPLCTAATLTFVAKKSGLTSSDWHRAGPLSRADWLKLWRSTCAQAYDEGILTGTGRPDRAARARINAIFRKTLHQMLRSGDIAIIP